MNRNNWVRALALVCFVAAGTACAPDRPLVERWVEGAWQPTAFGVISLGGQRGGAEVEFILRLQNLSGQRLVLEGQLEIDPQPELVASRWEEDGEAARRSGDVTLAAIDFFGGQGGRPSMGGQFTLSGPDGPTYRINLPPTELSPLR